MYLIVERNVNNSCERVIQKISPNQKKNMQTIVRAREISRLIYGHSVIKIKYAIWFGRRSYFVEYNHDEMNNKIRAGSYEYRL